MTSKTTTSSTKRDMQPAYPQRSRCRGTYYRPHIYAYLETLSAALSVSFSAVVNQLLERVIANAQPSSLEQTLRASAQLAQLRAEEAELFHLGRQILRSGSHLPDYARRLFTGDHREYVRFQHGKGAYADLSPAEQDAMNRILTRREAIAKEMADLIAQLYPNGVFHPVVTERGLELQRKPTKAPAAKPAKKGGEPQP